MNRNNFSTNAKAFSQSVPACLEHYQVLKDKGLDSQEVAARQALYGKNSLPTKKKKGHWSVFLAQFISPLIGLLLVSAIIIWFMDHHTDALVVLGVVVLNAIMGTVQEGRAARSLAALRKLSLPHTRVLREGQEIVIDAIDLVPGDIVILAAGDAVTADLRIVEASGLEANEAALTGETYAVAKSIDPLPRAEALYEQTNMLFAGTHIAKGRCLAIVTATGIHTEVGKIATLSETGSQVKTPIEIKITQFGHHLTLAAVLIFLLFFGVGFLRDLPLQDIFLAAVSQLVSIIPEGLPVAITIALAVGVQRMAKKGTLVRRLHAVETLGSTTIICTDKTGTLTKNEMTAMQMSLCSQPIMHVEANGYNPTGKFLSLSSAINPLSNPIALALLEACTLCNDANITLKDEKWLPLGDPMEAALVTLAKKGGIDIDACRNQYPRLAEIPFSSELKMMATCHEGFVLIKGALEEILAICEYASLLTKNGQKERTSLSPALRHQIESQANETATSGHRVLGIARVNGTYPSGISIESLRGQGEWLGFVAFIDPPREEALEAVSLCRKAHIRPIMITGDHLTTASAIAAELGILHKGEKAIDGKELALLSEEEFLQQCRFISVYARMQPEQKLKVIQTLQSLGEVVAMTGDGVNDAPALAKADVGVAMGSGTEVAKEAAKIVITDDNFATLVKAVEQGRLVYRNIVKVMFYLLATTFAAAFVMVLAISLGYPLPMAAVQILWINVVTEGTITINLVMDPPDGSEMLTPPLRKTDSILSRSNIGKLLGTILVIGGILFSYFLYMLSQQKPLILVQTEVFTLLAICAWFKLLSSRSETRSALTFDFFRNRYLTIGLIISILLQIAVLYVPELNKTFHTVPLTGREILLLFGIGSLVLWIDEGRKWIKNNIKHHQ